MENKYKHMIPALLLSILLFLILINLSCSNVNSQTQIIANKTQSITLVISSQTTVPISLTTQTTITSTGSANEKTVIPTNISTLEPTKTSRPIYNPTTVETGTLNPTLTGMPADFNSVILYDAGGPSGGGTWIYSVNNKKSQVIAPDYFSSDWSPSGKNLLLYQDQNLYISKSDGSDIKLILSGNGVNYGPHWLTEEWILLDSFNIDNHRTRVDLLNISTGELRSLDEDKDYEIIGVSPSRDFWFQLNTETRQMEIANMEGYRSTLEIPGAWGDIGEQRKQFLPSSKTVITEGCEGYPPGADTSCHIYSSEINDLTISNIKSIYKEESWMHVVNFLISPNGKYLAIYYFGDPNNHDMLISFLNIETLSIDYKYIFPNHMSDEYIWSADSTMIATPYWNESTQTAGIQTMNIFTGVIDIIHLTNYVPRITSWRMIDIYK